MADHIVNGVHDFTGKEQYIYPKNPVVAEHLEWFRGLKLGFMMHWMPSCQFSSYESWPLEPSSTDWSREAIDWTDDMDEMVKQYKDCNKTFNPFKFEPEKWASLAKECGFKYVLFTTKHHDGFCMYDSQYSDYKITSPDCPFHTNKRANIAKEVFDAFRAEGLAISAYYSKPDWHSEHYWNPDFPIVNNSPTYDLKEHPEIWEKFTQFVHNQLTEITSDYGKIDVLWLDGGQVRPDNGQDIRLGEVVEKIRATTQPHLLVCDRTVGGPYENIVTPEGGVPAGPLDIPWEACIPLPDHFAYHFDDGCKSPKQLVHMFIDIISKGGSLALNMTPRPDGKIPQIQEYTLRQFGRWMRYNSEAVYDSTIAFEATPNREYLYTKKDKNIYLFYLYTKEAPFLPNRLFPKISEGTVKKAVLLRTGEEVPLKMYNGNLILDTSNVNLMDADYADVFRLEME